jgi:DNA-directed RNA polymerase specialized sigma24 family protein
MLRAEEFEALLRQLGPDRDWAGARYEQLRQRLVMVFTYRGCPNAEELADETMDRVAHRLAERPGEFEGGDPTKFILGVAWNVAHESFRRRRAVALPEDWDPVDPQDPAEEDGSADRQECLEGCLVRLPVKHQELLLQYYAEDKRARIMGRSSLARQLAMTPNALRLKIHRMTIALRTCAFACMKAKQRDSTGTPGVRYH